MMRLLTGLASSGGSTLIRPPSRISWASRAATVKSASILRNDDSDIAIAAASSHQARSPSMHRTTRLRPPTIGSAGSACVPPTMTYGCTILRGFAAAASPSTSGKKKPSPSNKGDPASDVAASLGYLALKKARKEKRRELYEASLQRKARLGTRRGTVNRDAATGRFHRSDKKAAFHRWFVRQKVTNEYMNRKARQLGLDWQIQVSAMLIRNNVVLPDKEPWERDMEDLQAHLGQFGKMYPRALIDVDYDAPFAITDEELLELLPEGYTPAPRVTEHDRSGNVRTTDRKLKTDVYLVVQSEPQGLWHLPTTSLRGNDNETLLQAAQRAVAESVGPGVEHWAVSNAPLSVQMSAFTNEERDDPSRAGYYGTKTFFLKLYYDEGEASTEGRALHDFAWLDREEIVGRVKDQQGDETSTFYRYLL